MSAFISLLSSFDLLPWEPRTVATEPQVGFIAHVVIGGVDFHAIAIPVVMRPDPNGGSAGTVSYQEALDPTNNAELEGLYAAWEPGSPFTTATIRGYECVVTFQPYAQ